jgi:hypothetical protein
MLTIKVRLYLIPIISIKIVLLLKLLILLLELLVVIVRLSPLRFRLPSLTVLAMTIRAPALLHWLLIIRRLILTEASCDHIIQAIIVWNILGMILVRTEKLLLHTCVRCHILWLCMSMIAKILSLLRGLIHLLILLRTISKGTKFGSLSSVSIRWCARVIIRVRWFAIDEVKVRYEPVYSFQLWASRIFSLLTFVSGSQWGDEVIGHDVLNCVNSTLVCAERGFRATVLLILLSWGIRTLWLVALHWRLPVCVKDIKLIIIIKDNPKWLYLCILF